MSRLSNYQLILFIILIVLSISSLIIGFALIDEEGIGSGIIGGGVLTAIYSYFFAQVGVMIASLFSGLSSFTGALMSPLITGLVISNFESASSKALPYVNVVFLFIVLLILILFAHIKLERKNNYEQ